MQGILSRGLGIQFRVEQHGDMVCLHPIKQHIIDRIHTHRLLPFLTELTLDLDGAAVGEEAAADTGEEAVALVPDSGIGNK